MTYVVIGDSHVYPDVWTKYAIDAHSYPGATIDEILMFEDLSRYEHIILIAGTNDQLLPHELAERYKEIEHPSCTIVLPFVGERYQDILYGKLREFGIKTISFMPDVSEVQDDGIHLNRIGKNEFVKHIISMMEHHTSD